ncbi:hypothetical protein G9A89_002398 [Geosiphon pyriformis]|nr:hypothetical protein G9A89_002398 [Geosiphon pyriformis]
MTIELVQRIENNQRIHLKSTLLVFASAPVMASPKQLEIISNHKDSDLNLILISFSNSLIKNNKIMAHLDCNNPLLSFPAPRNNDNQNNKINNNNVLN